MRFFALLLLVANCEKDETLTGYGAAGSWTLTHINEQPFAAQVTINFSNDGAISGKAPCNSFSAQQIAPYPWFELGPIIATQRACANLSAEQDFYGALGSMSLVEVSGDILILSNDAGDSLQFKKQSDG